MKDGRWIRIHPVPFRMEGYNQFEKYHWIRLDLKKSKSDKRPESYVPESDHEILEKVDYNDSSLLNYIDNGDIGLPEIQRPFV
ncbi:MAG: hypothetical protein GQ565_05340 [Candidatus Aegiribacteria sp.]|nr:hypothetical protein [Candidatus Aegiribacteria sp.]